MKILIVGGVAAGTKVAAKLKRENRDVEVLILTKGADISYAGCGLPYYVGDVIKTRDALVVNTPEAFMDLTGAEVRTGVEVTTLDRAAKTVTAAMPEGGTSTYSYNKLVIATGASPFVPRCEGLDLENVFFMRTPDDAGALRKKVDAGEIRRAVVVGGGLIGLEVAENLSDRGVKTSVIDFAPHVLSEMLDPEMSAWLENTMAEVGVMTFTGVALEGISGAGKVEKVLTSRRPMKADAVVLAMGFCPNTGFLKESGLEMSRGTILVDGQMRTSDPDIYAAGDCALVTNRMTGQRQWSAMGSTANISGRLAALRMAGSTQSADYPGVLGTGVAKLPGANMGRTGLTEKAAREAGFDVETVVTVTDDKAHYYPGAGSFLTKMLCDRKTHKLLGLQVMGKGAVDKMTDIAVTAISLGATLEDLQYCDFAYTPPFSTAIHPFAVTVNVLLNKLAGDFETFTPAQYASGEAEGWRLVDCSIQPSIKGAPYMDLTAINGPVEGFTPDEKLLLVCSKGKRAYLAQNRLKHYGYTNTRVLEGGTLFNTEIQE